MSEEKEVTMCEKEENCSRWARACMFKVRVDGDLIQASKATVTFSDFVAKKSLELLVQAQVRIRIERAVRMVENKPVLYFDGRDRCKVIEICGEEGDAIVSYSECKLVEYTPGEWDGGTSAILVEKAVYAARITRPV